MGPKAGFPVKSLSGQNYTIELGSGMGNHELGTVVSSTLLDPRTKTQELHLKSMGKKFRYEHFATGSVISALTGDYDDMVVSLDDPKKK